LKKPNTKE